MEEIRGTLQSRQAQLKDDLRKLRDNVDDLREDCPDCTVPDTGNLETDADYGEVRRNTRKHTHTARPPLRGPTLVQKTLVVVAWLGRVGSYQQNNVCCLLLLFVRSYPV